MSFQLGTAKTGWNAGLSRSVQTPWAAMGKHQKIYCTNLASPDSSVLHLSGCLSCQCRMNQDDYWNLPLAATSKHEGRDEDSPWLCKWIPTAVAGVGTNRSWKLCRKRSVTTSRHVFNKILKINKHKNENSCASRSSTRQEQEQE